MPICLIFRRLGLGGARNALSSGILVGALTCSPLWGLNPDWHIYQYGHRVWRIGDTLPGGIVRTIAQSGDGYLWVATSTGLYRFDGVRATPWTPPPGISFSGPITSMLPDRDGTLWIGTPDGLSHWENGHLIRYKSGERTAVTQILQDDRGTVWFTPFSFGNKSSDILCNVTDAQLTCDKTHAGLPSEALSQDSSGTIWAGESVSLTSWRKGLVRTYPVPALRNNTSQLGIVAIAPEADGSLFVGIARRGRGLGLQRFRNGNWSAVTAPAFDGSSHRIRTLWMDRSSALWIGTADDGIYRLYQGSVDHFSSRDGLSSDDVLTIHGDREGSVWVGTMAGLDQFRDLAVQTFSRSIYPRAAEFDNLVTTPDGTLWVGCEGALYSRPKGSTTFVRQGGNLSGKQLTTIFGDNAGRIWIGVENTLNLFDHARFIQVKRQDGHPTGFIVSMAEEPDGTLWALTTGPPRTILSINPHTLRATPALPTVDASKIAGDPRGGLWIGSNSGEILHYSKGDTAPVPFAHDSNSRIAQLSVEPHGAILYASESGLAYMLGRDVHVLDLRNGLPCSNVNSFVFDRRGDLWLYMVCGLAEISRSQFERWLKDPSARIEPRVFDSSDGFSVFLPPFEGAARSADGKLWFNSIESLEMVDPVHFFINTIPPPVHLEGVRADFRDRPLVRTIQFPPLTHEIEIDYSALSFSAPEKIRFRYSLDGFDPNWHDVGARRQAIYTNLGPGRYRFQVIASNNDGVWNTTGEALSFTIAPKFYQTNWFLVCVVLIGLALIYVTFIVRLRVSTNLVEGRMNERLLERDRIARELHDTLLQGFQGIVLRLQGVAKMLSESAPSRLALEDAMDRADQILIDGRQSLLQLRSNTGAELRLAEQLNEAIADLQRQAFIPCALSIKGQERVLKPTVHEEIFAMAREALTNAFRHSKAAAILVELGYTKTQFSFRCADDGIGLPPDILTTGSKKGHWGLVGLRERADNLRARLNIQDNAPNGTVVEIILRARAAYLSGKSPRLRRLISGVRNS